MAKPFPAELPNYSSGRKKESTFGLLKTFSNFLQVERSENRKGGKKKGQEEEKETRFSSFFSGEKPKFQKEKEQQEGPRREISPPQKILKKLKRGKNFLLRKNKKSTRGKKDKDCPKMERGVAGKKEVRD